MTKKLKWYLGFTLCILMSGCDKPIEKISDEMKEKVNYVAVFTDYVSNNCLTEIELYDEEGQVLTSETIKSLGDLSYQSFIENKYYMYGPGGLLRIDNDKLTIEKLADGDINDIDVEENDLYLYLNNGFTKEGTYDSKIKSLDGDFELNVDYHINDMEYHHGFLYTINTLESQEGKVFINVFEGNKKIHTFETEENGSFYVINDEVYLLTQNYLWNVNTKLKYPLIDETGKPISIFSTFEAIHNYYDTYILVNNEVSGSNFYFMDVVDGTIQLSKLDVSNAGRIKNIVYVENEGFFIVNNNKELFRLTIDERISNLQRMKIDFGSHRSLFIGYEIKNKLN